MDGGRRAAGNLTSAISTNSKSSVFLTTLAEIAAAGLKGPGCMRSGSGARVDFLVLRDAAAASRSKPPAGNHVGLNSGRLGSASGVSPVPAGGGTRERWNRCKFVGRVGPY